MRWFSKFQLFVKMPGKNINYIFSSQKYKITLKVLNSNVFLKNLKLIKIFMWQSHLMINKKNGIKAKFAANIIHYKVIKLIHDVKYVIAQ